LRHADRFFAFLLAIGVLAAVFGLRACRESRARPASLPATEEQRSP
jgi:hypothetical protein